MEDRPAVDLLLVMGTSLRVSPVSEILSGLLPHSSFVPTCSFEYTAHLRHSVPQVRSLMSALSSAHGLRLRS